MSNIKITSEQIKELRQRTKAGLMDCRQALEECGCDKTEAAEWLRQKGIRSADKRIDRQTSQGLIEAYIHAGSKIVGLVELLCETDFVARTDEFKNLAHEIAMQIAAMNPKNTTVLLAQPWIKDESKKIEELVKELSGKTGENIKVGKIIRLAMNE